MKPVFLQACRWQIIYRSTFFKLKKNQLIQVVDSRIDQILYFVFCDQKFIVPKIESMSSNFCKQVSSTMGDFLFSSFKKTFLRASLKLSEFILLAVGKIMVKGFLTFSLKRRIQVFNQRRRTWLLLVTCKYRNEWFRFIYVKVAFLFFFKRKSLRAEEGRSQVLSPFQ